MIARALRLPRQVGPGVTLDAAGKGLITVAAKARGKKGPSLNLS
jgi:hypothetical protein